MPNLSVWAIRASLVYLMAGFTIGAAMLWNRGVQLDPRLWLLLSAHIEFLLVGWILQLTVGVAYWILPRHRTTPKRGNPWLAWASVAMLNVGILLVAGSGFSSRSGDLLTAGRIVEFIAVAAFALNSWPRLRQSIG